MRESFHEYGERERFENRDELRTTVSLAFFFSSSGNRSLGSISPYNLRRVSSLITMEESKLS